MIFYGVPPMTRVSMCMGRSDICFCPFDKYGICTRYVSARVPTIRVISGFWGIRTSVCGYPWILRFSFSWGKEAYSFSLLIKVCIQCGILRWYWKLTWFSASLARLWATLLVCILTNFTSKFTKSVINKCLQLCIMAMKSETPSPL